MMDSLDHLRSTHAGFNRGAPWYDRFADAQREAAIRLLSRVADLPEPYRILDAGCGSGQCTQLLLERFPGSRVDAFDISEAMLDVAAERLPGARVRWLHSEFEQFTCALTYPLVVSSSSLHWAPSLSAAVGNLTTCLAPGGTLAASIMVDGTFRELRACREIVAPGKPMRRPMPVLADLALAVDEKDLVRADSGHYEVTIRHDSAQDFLQCIHEQGLTGGRYFRPIEPLTRHEIDALADEYNRRFPHPDGGIQATYVIGWVVARSRG